MNTSILFSYIMTCPNSDKLLLNAGLDRLFTYKMHGCAVSLEIAPPKKGREKKKLGVYL